MGVLKKTLQMPQKQKPVFIDRTDLEAYALCTHQGFLRKKYAEKIKVNDKLPVVGETIHKIAEEAIKACDMNLQEAADYFANELPKALGRTDLQPEVVRAGKSLANELRRFGTNTILLCEEQIARTILPATESYGEVIVTTKPDLVLATQKNDTILVLDYKTGYKERTSSEARDAFQTDVICWCLKAKFPYVETIHFFYIQTRTNSRAYAKIQFSQIVDGLITEEGRMAQRIMIAADNYKTGFNVPWPEPEKCSQCPVIDWCSFKDAVAGEVNGDAKAYLDHYVVLQANADRMLDSMKLYVKDGKVIYGSKSRFAFEPSKPKYLPKVFEKGKDNGE